MGTWPRRRAKWKAAARKGLLRWLEPVAAGQPGKFGVAPRNPFNRAR